MSKKILIVDDSGTERLYLSELLGKIENIEVTEADGPDAAIGQLAIKKYDLIFIDYFLKGSLGSDLKKMILEKNPGYNAATNAIVLGSATDFQGDFLKKTGFINYLEKPVEFNMLKAAISMYAKVSD
ncbi:response regulator [Butyrivibrio sp. INlla16]|uniref:response regulator n=1 Tax=Butyrivibrio sp. INlla16 TaxID=1520807 RepID=UPI000880E08D|nr:response regulator [Butyrivibrio sp. INlla16]SDB11110.1 Response regulator receiver domain-containing protein [Butyrivibrio sp. INlla16]